MRLSQKIAGFVLLALIAGWSLGFLAFDGARRVIRSSIERGAVSEATRILDEIDQLIQGRVVEWSLFCQSEAIQEELARANRELEETKDLDQLLARRDREWRSSRGKTEVSRQVAEGELSRLFRQRLRRLHRIHGEDVVPEAFITGVHGANLGQTNITSDYYQADERWWLEAVRRGVHVSDVGFDESAGAITIDICLRIDDENHNLAGVLKASVHVRDIVEVVRRQATAAGGHRVTLWTEDGKQVCSSSGDGVTSKTSESPPDTSSFSETRQVLVDEVKRDGERIFRVVAHSGSRLDVTAPGWSIVIDELETRVMGPVHHLRSFFILMGALATVIMLILSLWFSRQVTSRLGSLVSATDSIGGGDLTARALERGRDEVGVLARKFNEMGDNLALAQKRIEQDEAALLEKNELLEIEIKERERLERERAYAEEHLRQTQKLEAIGRLASGVAHEINTPIQYVGDNLNFLEESFREVCLVVERAESLLSDESLDTNIQDFRNLIMRADFDFLATELPQAIAQSLEGVSRVSEIVNAMRGFARPLDNQRNLIDLNEAIRSTLTVARSEWKFIAEIETDLCTELPMMSAIGQSINQVILNLVVNAADAIQDKIGEVPASLGTIRITTRLLKGDWIELRVSDDGLGIPAAIQDRIYDPFFTTKEVGRGTGQGLSIVFRVVREHGGKVSFLSEEGIGTTFTVRLPVFGPVGESESQKRLEAAES